MYLNVSSFTVPLGHSCNKHKCQLTGRSPQHSDTRIFCLLKYDPKWTVTVRGAIVPTKVAVGETGGLGKYNLEYLKFLSGTIIDSHWLTFHKETA